jgi:soluble lytic murein transglycosylase
MTRIPVALLLLLAAFSARGEAPDLDAQRKTFRQAYAQAEAGRWSEVAPRLAALEGYPLLPDLRAAWLGANLGPATDEELGGFLERHDAMAFSRNLRYRWAVSLARRGEWARYLDVYQAHYAAADDTVLHCHAVTGRVRLGRTEGLEPEVLAIWLAPVSQPGECDPAFEWLEARGAITPDRRRERIDLALPQGEIRLARWLARPLGEAELARIARWERMRSNPAGLLADPDDFADSPDDRALVLYGFGRLASANPERAAELWPRYDGRFAFEPDASGASARRIAMVHAWRHLPGAQPLLEALPAEARDETTGEWTVRVMLRARDWPAARRAVESLEAPTAEKPAWRYWHARLLEAAGETDRARPLFADLAAERGYYSFLAADRLGADYNWRHDPTTPNEDVIAALAAREDIVRARELFFTGQEGRGRIEWARAMERLSPEERAQASLLATGWGWYSQAIATASSSGLRDDLDLRFPLPWRPVFESRSKAAGIPSAWAYGVARSESLFMPDVTSSAGAVGLMQLMPATGKQIARSAGVRYRGRATLTDPEDNVSLGTTYLSSMLDRFEDNRVLATAAYNAGPHRVARWLPEDSPLEADVWVETVPFDETRGYVQRVLASDAVFQWRMSGRTVRLAEVMPPVPPRRSPQPMIPAPSDRARGLNP